MTTLVPSSATRRSLEQRTSAYEQQMDGSPAETYLKGRGITNEAIVRFRLGYVGSPTIGDEQYHGRIHIPYLTPTGVVCSRFRAVDDLVHPKYKSEHGVSGRPFNVWALRSVEPVMYITEGELDAISATVAGLPAVGFPGATSWDKLYSRMFRFRRVVILADDDGLDADGELKAGGKFANKVASDLNGAKIITMTGGDVNSVLIERGVEGLRKMVGL